jgi:signal transduction histidine kinase
VTGEWDEGALKRIVTNLAENAIKFTPTGGAVEVRVRDDGADAVLEVADTGVGIDAEFLPDIFNAFEQEEGGIDREHEGSGLGLAITKRLTEALGGTIDVESEKGEGTCFTVRLPRTHDGSSDPE